MTAYARSCLEEQQWAFRQRHLGQLQHQQQEMLQNQDALQKVHHFVRKAEGLGLEEQQWAFYDVHVQGAFDFETARQIIEQCSDSDQAYYWPISLEAKTVQADAAKAPAGAAVAAREEVQLTVKGKFVARQQ